MAPPLSIVDLDLVLAQTKELWEETRGQRIFITGGTGFFGCWLVETFCHVNRALGLGASATVLSRDPAKFAAKCPHLAGDPAITLHPGDVRDFDFPAGEFKYVIHAATDNVIVPSKITMNIQESHLALEHIYCMVVERCYFGPDFGAIPT